MSSTPRITVAHGDGIGPEIMDATLAVLRAAGARFEADPVELGEAAYRRGIASGIAPEAWERIRANRVLLKAPLATPQGGGFKSVNVTLRKALGLFANVRPCVSYAPFVATRHPKLDLLIVRENEEDLYAGIEHRQTDDVYQCLKLVSRPGCERLVRYAFEAARRAGRRKVSCMTKDNIMKMTDGLFHRVFDEIARDYPELQTEHLIIDIGAARIADTPERFDVVVTPNLYGDILSDVAAQLTGSVGLAGSANVGDGFALFEAIHGSAPDIAGRDVANPSGLLHAAIMMLAHLGQGAVARSVHDAWLATIEDGVHTADIAGAHTLQPAGTRAFAEAVIERLGRGPRQLAPSRHADGEPPIRIDAAGAGAPPRRPAHKDMVGIDVFVHARDTAPQALGARMAALAGEGFRLEMITNRGVKVWPEGFPETFCTDHWRCRFMRAGGDGLMTHRDAIGLLDRVADAGVDFIKTEALCRFDGVPGYSMGQGQ